MILAYTSFFFFFYILAYTSFALLFKCINFLHFYYPMNFFYFILLVELLADFISISSMHWELCHMHVEVV